jgi:hypothetical protein
MTRMNAIRQAARRRLPELCSTATLAPILALVVVAGTGLGVADEPRGLGDRVIAYCKEHKGKRVGNGSCTEFVGAALQAAGAKLRGPDDPIQQEAASDFNWGERFFVVERDRGDFRVTGRIADVRAGDIIQFTNTTLTGALDEVATYTMKARHHTAIISGVEEDGNVLKIYHQGANGRKRVSLTSLRLRDLQKGRFDIFHPIEQTESGRPKLK